MKKYDPYQYLLDNECEKLLSAEGRGESIVLYAARMIKEAGPSKVITMMDWIITPV